MAFDLEARARILDAERQAAQEAEEAKEQALTKLRAQMVSGTRDYICAHGIRADITPLDLGMQIDFMGKRFSLLAKVPDVFEIKREKFDASSQSPRPAFTEHVDLETAEKDILVFLDR